MISSSTEIAYLRKLYNQSDCPVIITDHDGSVIFSNLDPGVTDDMLASIYDNNFTITHDEKYWQFCKTKIDNGHLLTATEITNLIKERDFYKETLDNLPADIGVFDNMGTYLYVNPAGIKDDTLRKWIIGKTDFDYCDYRERDHSLATYRSSLYKKIRETNVEIGYEEEIKLTGKETNYQLRKLRPVFDENGEIRFILAYGINISDRKKAEIAQQEALGMIERAARAKEEFVAVMSHEIRTPMNAIIGMSRLLSQTALNELQSKYLDAILSASGNLIVIVNDILDFSKIEAGKLRLEYAGFSFAEVISYAKSVTSAQALEKGLALEFVVEDNVSEIFIGDLYRINQVIVNLLTNAIKFTEKGKVSVRIRVEDESGEEQHLCICVKDTGIGMTAEFMQQLFTMYSQEAGITRKYGGTGLGLKITAQLVELMNGRIEVESKKNEGSCIKVKLSLKKGTETDLQYKSDVWIPENILLGKKILIAEDNNLNVLVASTVLQNYGATVVTAEDGSRAVELLKHDPAINAILMDVEMPVMDGIEATMIIRRDISDVIPIIALTANVLPQDKEKLMTAGMNAYVTKPFSELDLIRALTKLAI